MTVPLDLTPTTRDIAVASGSSARFQFRWLIASTPQSLVDMRAVFSVAKRAGSTPVITATSDSGEITLQPDDGAGNAQVGVLDVLLPPEMTARLKRNAVYDLVVIDGSGDVMRIFQGAVLVSRGVTPVAASDPDTDTTVVSLGPARQNLVIYRGDTFAISFVLKDADGVPLDLTGYTPTAQVRTDNGTLVATINSVLGSDPGRVDLTLSAEDTAALPAYSFYDVQLAAGGNVRTYLAGSITVHDDITSD